MEDIKQEHDEPEIMYTTLYELYDEGDRIDEVNACRVCLLTDCRLYPLVDLSEENPYTQVSGLSLHEDDGLPRSLCAECYTLLNKCMQFREKSRMGYQCLMQILEKHSKVTVDTVKKVNRNKFKLNSNLTIVKKEPHFDYQFVDESDVVFDENKMRQELTVKYNTLKYDDHLYAMNDDSNDSTYTEINVPVKMAKNRQTEHSEDEEITFENIVTDNVCIDIDEDSKDEPVIFVVQNNNFKAEDKLKSRSKKQHVKAKDNIEGKLLYKSRHLNLERLIKDNFTTKVLSIKEQKETILKRKSSNNYVKSEYKCDYCFKGFLRELPYKSHMLKHSEKSGKFACDICHRRWMNKRKLRLHMLDHTHLYSCVSCSFSTQNRSGAKLHLDWHQGKKYKCDLCEMEFLRVSTLLSHLRIKHPTDHVCHICGYSFLGEYGLSTHCNLKHGQDSREVSSDSPRCDECDITFISELALETHLKVSLRHATSDNLKRNVYQKKTGDQRGVKIEKIDVPCNRRELIAEGNSVTCKECGLQFLSRRALRIHTSSKHKAALPVTGVGPRTLCDVCGRGFKCEALLRDHALVHSGSASYSCTVCGKSYKTPTLLHAHAKRHTESYPCPRCDKTFNHRSNRDRHLTNIHSGINDIKCDFCEKMFKSDELRKSHTDHVHLKKPWPKRNRGRGAKDGQTVAICKSGKGITDDSCVE